MSRRVSLIFRTAAAFLAFATFVACAKKELAVSCGPEEQRALYMNPLFSGTVTTITVDGSFTNDEYAQIEGAVSTWNAYGQATLGHDLFSVTQSVSALANTASVPSSVGDCGFPGAGNAFTVVKITDDPRWRSLGMGTANPGVTIRCAAGGEYVARQVVLLNPNNTSLDQLRSVFAHELGHAVGLDHSCADGSGSPGAVGCGTLSSAHPYKQAIMYPLLRFNPIHPENAEIKEALNDNDRERAACILNYNPEE